MIRTVFLIAYVGLAIAIILPFFILYSWVTGSPEAMYELAMKTLRSGLRIVGVRVRVEGVENIPDRTCIFASNHVSNIDPVALVPFIPRRVAILAKKQVFRIPILATGMRMCQIVPVDRDDKEAAASSVNKAIQYIRSGTSFLVYPEGTRSPDGRLRAFKSGTFVMALEAGVPVVPVSLIGTQRLLPKGELSLRPGEVTVRFGPAVDSTDYKFERREVLRERVHDLVEAGLPEDQRPLPKG
jgi:1-acyl-sn-glycerol-3-phosphate acyltransferase